MEEAMGQFSISCRLKNGESIQMGIHGFMGLIHIGIGGFFGRKCLD